MEIRGEEQHLIRLWFTPHDIRGMDAWNNFCCDLRKVFESRENDGISILILGTGGGQVEIFFPETETTKTRQGVEEIAKKHDIEIKFQ